MRKIYLTSAQAAFGRRTIAPLALVLVGRLPCFRQRRDMGHLRRILLVDGPDVPARLADVIVHVRHVAGFVQVAGRRGAACGAGLDGHGQ